MALTQKTKSYSELMTLDGYDSRLNYLRLHSNNPANENRSALNRFYKSYGWKKIREEVIRRDLGCDLAVPNLFIKDNDWSKEEIIVHHINPITEEDLIHGSPLLLDMDNLITVSTSTHNTIHYYTGVEDVYVERHEGDTKLW